MSDLSRMLIVLNTNELFAQDIQNGTQDIQNGTQDRQKWDTIQIRI